MKKLNTILLFIMQTNITCGQQMILEQFFQNNYLINPAVTGIEGYLDLQLVHRDQWVNLDGAPTTSIITSHGSLNPNGFPRADFHRNPISNPANERMFDQRIRRSFSGFGGFALRDKVGVFQNLEAGLSYAYHLPLSKKMNLSLGIAPSLVNTSLDMDFISAGIVNDPAITGFGNNNQMNLKIGGWLYGRDLYFGLSYVRTILGNIDGRNDVIATMGYRFFDQAEIWSFSPFLITRYHRSSLNVDLGIKANWNTRFWLGAAYRTTNSIGYFVGFNINTLLGFTYLYSSGLEGASENVLLSSHEIGLQFRLMNRLKTLCPPHLF